MKKYYPIFTVIFSSLLIIILVGFGCKDKSQDREENPGYITETVERKEETAEQMAIIQCQELFQLKMAEGVDMSPGPCLSNDLIPDWVCDVAHNPRQEMDNDPDNQCSAFEEKKAHHFVELDQSGQVIQVY